MLTTLTLVLLKGKSMGGALAIIAPPIMTIIFIGWLFYLLLVKKAAKKQLGDILGGLMFISVWIAIYFVFIR